MNTLEMIASINLRGSFPEDQYFSNADFISILNDQLKLDIVPMLMKLNEEYFLTHRDFQITRPGQSFRIPKRAIGAKIRNIQHIDSSGNITNINRLYVEDESTSATGYYLKRNSIQLSNSFSSGFLRVNYFAAPNTLVLPVACGQIVTIDRNLNQVEVSSAPSTFVNGAIVDFVQNNNPFDIIEFDSSILNISGTTVSFNTLPEDLNAGDFICISGTSPVANIPSEIHPVLVQSALCVCVASKKDNIADLEFKKLEVMKQNLVNMLDPRVESSDSKVRPNGILSRFINR